MSEVQKQAWTVRSARPEDGAALGQLESDHPDSGAFGLSWHYRVDALQAQQALRPGSLCVVAQAVESGTVIAMGFATLGVGRFDEGTRPVGMIYGLVVHAQWRRLGIASALYQAICDRIRSEGGPHAIILAGVQEENEGSRKAAQKWANQAISGRTKFVMAAPPRKAPRAPSGLSLRAAADSDWPRIASGLNRLLHDHQLAPSLEAETLQALYQAKPFGEPLRTYLVAVDPSGQVIAGLGILFDSLVETGHFKHLPLAVKLLNFFLRILPSDGMLKRLVAKDLWYDAAHPQGEAAIAALWKEAAWRWRDKGNSLMFPTDQMGPLGGVLPRNPFLPEGGGWLMVSSEPPLDLELPIWLPI